MNRNAGWDVFAVISEHKNMFEQRNKGNKRKTCLEIILDSRLLVTVHLCRIALLSSDLSQHTDRRLYFCEQEEVLVVQ